MWVRACVRACVGQLVRVGSQLHGITVFHTLVVSLSGRPLYQKNHLTVPDTQCEWKKDVVPDFSCFNPWGAVSVTRGLTQL